MEETEPGASTQTSTDFTRTIEEGIKTIRDDRDHGLLTKLDQAGNGHARLEPQLLSVLHHDISIQFHVALKRSWGLELSGGKVSALMLTTLPMIDPYSVNG